MRRVHQEATKHVGANQLGWNSRWKRGQAYCTTEEMTLCSTGHVRNRILFIGRGLAYRKMEELGLLRKKRHPVAREACGVPQTEEMHFCWSATVETGVLFIGRGVVYRRTRLHGILFISTVDLL